MDKAKNSSIKPIVFIVISILVIVAIIIALQIKRNKEWNDLAEQYRASIVGKTFENITADLDKSSSSDIFIKEYLYIKSETEVVFNRTDYYGVGVSYGDGWSNFKPTTVFKDYPESTYQYEIKENRSRDSKGRKQFNL